MVRRLHVGHCTEDCVLYLAAVDLIEKLLDLDPIMRLTAEQTLTHPYLSDYHDPADEPIFEASLASDKFPEVYSCSDLETSRWKGTLLIYILLKLSLVVGMLHAVLCRNIRNRT